MARLLLLLLLLAPPCISHELFSCDENHDGSCDPIESKKLSETLYKTEIETGSVWWIFVIALPTLVGLLLLGLVYKCMANDDDKERTRKDCKMNVLFSALDQAFAAHTTTTTTTTTSTSTSTATTIKTTTTTTATNNNNLPFVTLAYAQSLDGSLAGVTGRPLALSGAASMLMTHKLRAWHDAIVVGVGTVIADNPSLTVRLCKGMSPLPIILDPNLRTPITSKLFTSKECRRPVIMTLRCAEEEVVAEEEEEEEVEVEVEVEVEEGGSGGAKSPSSSSLTKRQRWMETRAALELAGAVVVCCDSDPLNRGWLDLVDVMRRLGTEHDRKKIMVEGGAGIITSMLETHAQLKWEEEEEEEEIIKEEKKKGGLIHMLNVTTAPLFVGGVHSVQRLLPRRTAKNTAMMETAKNVTAMYPRMISSMILRIFLDDDIVIQGPLE